MNIKVFIRQRNKDSENVIFRLRDGRKVDIHHKSEIIVNSLEFSNKKANVIIPSSQLKDANYKRIVNIQKKISERKEFIQDWYVEQNAKENLSSEDLTLAIDMFLYPQKYEQESTEQKPTTLLKHIDQFIENAQTKRKKNDNLLLSKSTIKSYCVNKNRITEFLDYKKDGDILLPEVDDKFVNSYIVFLTNKKKYANNTIGDSIKALKNFLSDRTEHKLNLKKLSVLKESVDNVYLNETELKKVKDLDLKKFSHLDKARDLFLCLAWTCSRVSDINKIANVKNGLISYNQQKTNNKVVIPLHPIVAEILLKYNDTIPTISDQKLNVYIKEVCKLAEINETIAFTRTQGGIMQTTYKEKHELIGTHTGRRSFCTNMYLRGLDTLMIMSISGHKTEKSFLTYIKVSHEEHAKRMAEKWSEFYK